MEDEDSITHSIRCQRSLLNTRKMEKKIKSEPAMEMADRPVDNLVYSTPLIYRPEMQSWSVQTGVSNDSGFSDRHFNLTGDSNTTDVADFGSPLFSKSADLLSSPKENTDRGRRSTLTDCEFSPVQETTSIRGRRLLFKTFDGRPPALQLPFADFDRLEMNELNSILDCKSNVTKPMVDIGKEKCNKKVSPSAEQSNIITVNKYNEDSSFAGSPLSGSTDDLEISLQEMSLEEMTSSWSSCSRKSSVSLHLSSSQDSLSDNKVMMKHEDDKSDFESFSDMKEQYVPGDTRFDVCCSQTCESSVDYNSSDGIFKKAQSESPLYLDHAYSKENALGASQSLNHNLTVCVEHLDSHSTTNRIPPLPSEYNVLNSQDLSIFFNGLTENIHFPKERLFLKSPNKRHSSEFEYDGSLMHSPTKYKRTLDDNARSELTNLLVQTTAELLEYEKSFQCSNISGRLLFPENQATNAKEKSSLDVSSVDNKVLLGDSSCNIIDSDKPCSSKDSCDSLPDIAQQGIHIKCVDSLLSSLPFQKVMKSFSPSEPTRLIGRNVGVRKLDIIQKLSPNFSPILENIFQHLDPADLDSVCKVNGFWKKALYNDKKAYGRYKLFKEVARIALHEKGHGKENCGEKLLSGSLTQNLTISKGHLTCMQTQAQKIESKPDPVMLEPKFSLRSDDQLRRCPHCQGSAVIQPNQERAICVDLKCGYDFCTQCFAAFHHPKRCKPLCSSSSTAAVAGTRKSKKNLKRL